MRHFSAKQYLVSPSSTHVELRFVKRYRRLGQDFLWNFWTRIRIVCTDCVSNTELRGRHSATWRIEDFEGIRHSRILGGILQHVRAIVPKTNTAK